MTWPNPVTDKRTHIAALAICFGAIISACSNNDDNGDNQTTGGTTGVPDTSIFNSDPIVTLQVVGADGMPQDSALVEVINDPSNAIVAGDDLTENTGVDNNGIVTFGTRSFDGTRNIQVRVTKTGFMANNLPVSVAGGQDIFEIVTITSDVTEDVTGIGTAGDAADITQDALMATATAMSDDQQNPNPASSTVMIPQNSVAMTRDGEPLGSELSMSIVHFDADQNESLLAFPGGFATSIANPDDLMASGLTAIDGADPVDDDGLVFESLGFVAIEVRDEQDQIASTFNQPIEITTEIKADTPHPTAEPPRSVQAGDEIPIWSFDEVTGEWSFEQTGTVEQSADGGLLVRFTTDHLSYYNLDYFRGRQCTVNLNFVRSDSGAPLDYFNGTVRATGFIRNFRTRPGFEGFRLAPADTTLSLINLRTVVGDEIIATPSSFSCNGNSEVTVNVSLEVPNETPTFPVSISASTFCSNIPDADPVPLEGAYVYIYRNNPYFYANDRTGANGTSTLQNAMIGPGTYRVYGGINLNGQWVSQSANVQFSETNSSAAIQFAQECQIVTGGTGTGG